MIAENSLHKGVKTIAQVYNYETEATEEVEIPRSYSRLQDFMDHLNTLGDYQFKGFSHIY